MQDSRFIPRRLGDRLLAAARRMPVLVLSGPRQSGKSTLARHLFPQSAYTNLEDPEQRQFALQDPRGFLQAQKGAVIIDEVQNAPTLLSYIQVMVDEDPVPGKFLLTGSQNLLLMEGVSQSLAGRASIHQLLPLSLDELASEGKCPERYEEALLRGGYPRIWDLGLPSSEWLQDYINTYVERDMRQLIQVGDLMKFRQFLGICAGRIGQLVNFSEIGSHVGVSYHTAQAWLSVLETSYIVFRLPPWHRNYNKRIVRTPKLYFHDTGLACTLLGIRDTEALDWHFAKGALFENFIIAEMMKSRLNSGLPADLHFWRDSQMETDLVWEKDGRLHAAEIKSSRTILSDHARSLLHFRKVSGLEADRAFLIYGGDISRQGTDHGVRSWRNIADL